MQSAEELRQSLPATDYDTMSSELEQFERQLADRLTEPMRIFESWVRSALVDLAERVNAIEQEVAEQSERLAAVGIN